MGYLRNHLATVTTGAFAAVLTGLWPYFMDFAPDMNTIFSHISFCYMVSYIDVLVIPKKYRLHA